MHTNSLGYKIPTFTGPPADKRIDQRGRITESKKDSVSFTSGAGIIKTFEILESNPVLSLATIDFFGMIMPRTIIDTLRNKEELGHLNWDAGRETIMREVFSSGMMFFGPGIVFNWIGNKLLDSKFNPMGINTKAYTNYHAIDAIEAKLSSILKDKAGKISVNELRQQLAKEMLKDVKGATSGRGLSSASHLIDEAVKEVGTSMNRANIDKAIADFLKQHPTAKPGQVRKALIEARAKAIRTFLDKYVPKVAKHLQETEATMNIKGAKPITTSAGNIVRDVFSAADDIVMKAANGAEHINTADLKKGIEGVVKETKKLKVAKALVPFVVIFGLLTTFPAFSAWLTKKLNGGKDQFPGLAGLKDEKSSQKVAFSSTQASNPFNNSAPAAASLNTSTSSTPRSAAFEAFLQRRANG